MLNVLRLSRFSRILLCSLALLPVASLHAQVTLLDRQLSHVDLGVSGAGEFTTTVKGTNYLGDAVTQQPSSSLGALVTLRYIKSPLVGFEFNYGYARYTQNFTFVNNGVTIARLNGGAQTNANEYTLGYVAHTPKILGLGTFVAVGAGTSTFKGTPGGGQGLPEQARATYYYAAGVEDSIFSPHFGIRAQFRQAFFLAPDFGQNYLTIKQHQISTEPAIGFYLKF